MKSPYQYLALSMLFCTMTSCFHGAALKTAHSPPPTIVISGYVKVEGQTILLFKNTSDLKELDIHDCKTVGSGKEIYKILSPLAGHFARLKVENLGRAYFDLYYGNPAPAFHLVNGRGIDMWCADPNLYWAVQVIK